MSYSIETFQLGFNRLQKHIKDQRASLLSQSDLKTFDDTIGNLIDEVFVLDKLKDAASSVDSLQAMVEALREQNRGNIIDRLLSYTRDEPELGPADPEYIADTQPDNDIASLPVPSAATTAWNLLLATLNEPKILPTLAAPSLPHVGKPPPRSTRSTLETRRAVIEFYKAHGGLQMAVERFFALHRPDLKITGVKISKWMKQETRIKKEAALRQADKKAKRIGAIRHPRTKRALKIWLTDALDKGLRVTGDIIWEKWQEIATNLQDKAAMDLKCTNGWLKSFKRRLGLRNFTFIGEAGSTDNHAVAKERLRMQGLLKDMSLDDVYNVDETGVFYGNIPRHGLDTQSRAGVKQNKICFTLAVVCNASGTDKRQLFFIGTAAKPRCFDRPPQEYGYQYRNNKTAWMTAVFYNEWLAEFNLAMRQAKRKIVLLHDNFSGHKVTCNPVNITIHAFAPNLTSRVQPLDQGIIASDKAHYRRATVARAIRRYGRGVTDPKEVWKLDIREGMEMITKAWDKVTQKTIVNCWVKSGILQPSQTSADKGGPAIRINDLVDEDIPVDPAMAAVAQMMVGLQRTGCIGRDVTVKDLIEPEGERYSAREALLVGNVVARLLAQEKQDKQAARRDGAVVVVDSDSDKSNTDVELLDAALQSQLQSQSQSRSQLASQTGSQTFASVQDSLSQVSQALQHPALRNTASVTQLLEAVGETREVARVEQARTLSQTKLNGFFKRH